jgi:nitric oxide reductase activation protein
MADVEMTKDEIAAAYEAMGHSVAEVNSSKGADETDDEFAARKARNVEHLVLMKAKKKIDGTTSIWTTESFTAIDAAIAS